MAKVRAGKQGFKKPGFFRFFKKHKKPRKSTFRFFRNFKLKFFFALLARRQMKYNILMLPGILTQCMGIF